MNESMNNLLWKRLMIYYNNFFLYFISIIIIIIIIIKIYKIINTFNFYYFYNISNNLINIYRNKNNFCSNLVEQEITFIRLEQKYNYFFNFFHLKSSIILTILTESIFMPFFFFLILVLFFYCNIYMSWLNL